MNKIGLICICAALMWASAWADEDLKNSRQIGQDKENSDVKGQIQNKDLSLDSLEPYYPKDEAKPPQEQDHYLALYPHKAVYILPYYHSFTQPAEGDKDTETKFQFSFKIPIVKFPSLLPTLYKNTTECQRCEDGIYFAYTQTAWFQNYNREDSRPFRDIDYQPELFYHMQLLDTMLYDKRMRIYAIFGYRHLSNGERELRSRTMNAVVGGGGLEIRTLESGIFGVELMTWNYIAKGRDSFQHDNPDLPQYYGNAWSRVYYVYGRNLFEYIHRGSYAQVGYPTYDELGYTLRISDNLGIYVQYVDGYGDNIFEYRTHARRIGVGLRLWDRSYTQ